MSDLKLKEPVELTDAELDAVSGGASYQEELHESPQAQLQEHERNESRIPIVFP
jgi:hypothetical protein